MAAPIDQLTRRAGEWRVTVEKSFETDTSVLAFGLREGSPVVLKIIKHSGDEWKSGEILRAFNGDGMVRVYESEPGAVLLERLLPGNDLVNMVKEGNDEEATQILADVIKRMANHRPPPDCPTVFDWARGFDRHLQSGDQHVPNDLVHEAQELYLNLATSSSQTMLLHGDLQHYNLLFDEIRGWTSIDPKGVVGELEYELGAIIRNPIELPDFFTSREVVQRRLRVLTDTLDLNYQRALQWSFAQAVLSAIWEVEDCHLVETDHAALVLAQTIKLMLD
jgi:streptomycin 6-kinase